jgi:hypothetical protein
MTSITTPDIKTAIENKNRICFSCILRKDVSRAIFPAESASWFVKRR